MRRLSIVIALLLSCTATPVTVPSPSPTATASPIQLPSATASPSPRPDLTIVPAGEIRGDHALVLQVSQQPGGVTGAMRFWDVPLDGTAPKQLLSYNQGEKLLTQGDTFDFSRQLSPDGRQLVLADPVDMAGTGLLVVDLIAGTTRLIRTTGGADRPAWSPDGRRIAYRGFTVAGPLQKETGIWVVSAAGGTPQQVVAGALSGGGATWVYGWTEDGAGLAIGTGGAGVSDVSVVDVATGTLTRIGGAAHGVAIRAKRPSVAIVFEDQPSAAPPTGIAGAPSSAARVGHLEVRDTTFAAPRTVARYGVEGTMLWDPRWNPSSNEILMFWICGEGVQERDELVVVDGVTGARRALATSTCVRSASWNADGTKILYTGDLETARLRNADGSNDHVLFRPAMPPGAFQQAVIAVIAFVPR
jgi:WD40-like Beta Propeller Repeat